MERLSAGDILALAAEDRQALLGRDLRGAGQLVVELERAPALWRAAGWRAMDGFFAEAAERRIPLQAAPNAPVAQALPTDFAQKYGFEFAEFPLEQ